jgi:hypothetical protein
VSYAIGNHYAREMRMKEIVLGIAGAMLLLLAANTFVRWVDWVHAGTWKKYPTEYPVRLYPWR